MMAGWLNIRIYTSSKPVNCSSASRHGLVVSAPPTSGDGSTAQVLTTTSSMSGDHVTQSELQLSTLSQPEDMDALAAGDDTVIPVTDGQNGGEQ
jgi:hypothetical protein